MSFGDASPKLRCKGTIIFWNTQIFYQNLSENIGIYQIISGADNNIVLLMDAKGECYFLCINICLLK